MILIATIFALASASSSAGQADIPPPPPGYEVTSRTGTDEEVEEARLQAIVQKKKGFQDPKIERDVEQQLARMLRMGDATRNSAIRIGITQFIDVVHFESAYSKALLAYYSEIETERLLNDAKGVENQNAKTELRDQVVEFALFEFTVLRSRNINLFHPTGAELKRWSNPDNNNDAETFREKCVDFLLRRATSTRVREYVGLCLALTPHADKQLLAISEVTKLYEDSTVGGADLPKLFSAYGMFSKSLGDRPPPNIVEAFSTACSIEPTCVNVLNVYLPLGGEGLPAVDDDKLIFSETVKKLKAMKTLSAEQKKLLDEWDETPGSVHLEGVQDPTVRTTVNIGGNVYFGF